MKKYMYVVNYPVPEEDLCKLEMKTIFGENLHDKVLISDIKFNPSHSVFIKSRLEIIHVEETFEDLVTVLKNNPMDIDQFRIEFVHGLQGEVKYSEKVNYFNEVGEYLLGLPNLKNPKLSLGIAVYQGKWIFGINVSNDKLWVTRERKPKSYSNSLTVRVAKTVVNLACNGDIENSIIDPCCGIGTTIVEGVATGHNITGSELFEKNVANGNHNLEFFGLDPIITQRDINDINEKYFGCIVDIPYGLFSQITKEQQQNIISSARRISTRTILITFEDLDYMVDKAGFKIIDRCVITKGSFKRYILICE